MMSLLMAMDRQLEPCAITFVQSTSMTGFQVATLRVFPSRPKASKLQLIITDRARAKLHLTGRRNLEDNFPRRHLLIQSLSLSLPMTRSVTHSVELIVNHGKLTLPSKSINVIESPQLREIFLMLRKELRESDIPGRTTIRKRINEVLDEYFEKLQGEMEVQSFAFSFVI
jgi:hypothetical protein